MNLIFIGPPLSGKGTQSKLVSKEYNIPHISTGDMFREAYSNKTELGLKANEYMAAGNLVPDDLTIKIVKERLMKSDCHKGFLLDGFPRTLNQAKALSTLLEELNLPLTKVVSFLIPESELEKRLLSRLVCASCGESYHAFDNKPKIAGVCNVCQGEVKQREDDNVASLKIRLQNYKKLTKPLLDYYKDLNLLYEVDATLAIEEIFEKLNSELIRV